MTTLTHTRTTRTALGLLAALGIALAGLTALPAGEAAARPCQMPVEPEENPIVCHLGASPSAGVSRGIGEEIPSNSAAPLLGGLSGGIEGTD